MRKMESRNDDSLSISSILDAWAIIWLTKGQLDTRLIFINDAIYRLLLTFF